MRVTAKRARLNNNSWICFFQQVYLSDLSSLESVIHLLFYSFFATFNSAKIISATNLIISANVLLASSFQGMLFHKKIFVQQN
jgi:hypothetical protein